MRRFIYIVAFFLALISMQQVLAQPATRRPKAEAKEEGPKLSVRAQTQYSGQTNMPEEVMWKREIYRTLDLKEEKNTALYYPVEPMGNRVNLFTLIFKLLTDGKISAYEYRLDGTELFTPENKVKFKDVMDRFQVLYEEKVQGRRDTVLVVDNSDIPGSEVLSYFIKEVYYFDQRSSSYSSKVVALCPVLHRAGDFSIETVSYPMFWIKFADLSPYLNGIQVMTSNLNNASNVTLGDYFARKQYKGDIYKTTNMLNQTLSQYCPTDSALTKEREKIENQLKNFEKGLWSAVAQEKKTEAVAKDSTEVNTPTVEAPETNSKKKGRDNTTKTTKSKPKAKTVSSKQSSSKSSSSPKASVRRQRR